MTLQVSPELVRPVIEAKIQAAIVAELTKGDESGLFAGIVGRVLSQKVDKEGKWDTYGYSGSQEYIAWLCQGAIQASARKAVKEWVERNQAKFEKQFQQELDKRSSGFAKVFADGLLKCVASNWNFTVDVGFVSPKER